MGVYGPSLGVPDGGRLRLCVLGQFELRSGRDPLTLPNPAQRVLGFLAVQRVPQLRETVAGRLWPFMTEARAHGCLRTALWRIRQASTAIVAVDRDAIRLDDVLEVDLHTVTTEAKRLIEGLRSDAGTWASVDLFGRDLLPTWDEDWVLLERERLRQVRLHALEVLSGQLTAAGRAAEAIEAALAAVAAEPLRESAHRAVIEAHLSEGNRSEAARQAERYRRLLDEELGVTPSPLLTQLVESMSTGWSPRGA